MPNSFPRKYFLVRKLIVVHSSRKTNRAEIHGAPSETYDYKNHRLHEIIICDDVVRLENSHVNKMTWL